MEKQRDGLGTRFMAAINRVLRDNGPSWREPSLPGLAPTPVEKEIQRGWTSYHAETDRLAAERLPKEMPAPVTRQEGLKLEDQADARAHVAHVRDQAMYASLEGREDFADKLLREAREILAREGLDNDGRPLERGDRQRDVSPREREGRERHGREEERW